VEPKAICLPSGDQQGAPDLDGPLNVVTWIHCAPSPAQVHISEFPDRLDENAIRLPSGEYCALKSTAEDAVSLAGGGMAPARTGISCRQILL
jgi:hypothetical protein